MDVRPFEAAGVIVVRSAERFLTQREWSLTRHSFSFGGHVDPANTNFGLLVALNDELVQPGPGYRPHEHRDVDIVTWVVDGALRHEDSAGNVASTRSAQLLSAGSGVTHSERSASDGPVHFIQIWLRTWQRGAPYFQQADIAGGDDAVLPVASATIEAALRLREPGATICVGRGDFAIPAAAYVHLLVTRGEIHVGDHRLSVGDAGRITDGRELRAWSSGGEALIVAMSRAVR